MQSHYQVFDMQLAYFTHFWVVSSVSMSIESCHALVGAQDLYDREKT